MPDIALELTGVTKRFGDFTAVDNLSLTLERGKIPLDPGQRVMVRFNMKSKPLAVQAWTALLQVFQKKFQL